MHNSKTMHYLVTKVVGKRREDLPLPPLLFFSVLRAILYFWIFINKNNLVEQLPPKVTNTEKRKQSKGYGGVARVPSMLLNRSIYVKEL